MTKAELAMFLLGFPNVFLINNIYEKISRFWLAILRGVQLYRNTKPKKYSAKKEILGKRQNKRHFDLIFYFNWSWIVVSFKWASKTIYFAYVSFMYIINE